MAHEPLFSARENDLIERWCRTEYASSAEFDAACPESEWEEFMATVRKTERVAYYLKSRPAGEPGASELHSVVIPAWALNGHPRPLNS